MIIFQFSLKSDSLNIIRKQDWHNYFCDSLFYLGGGGGVEFIQ